MIMRIIQKFPNLLTPNQLSFSVLLCCSLTFGQLVERITILENSPVNTVILDIRSVLLRRGDGQLPPNATAYASQQETFWPFTLEDFVIKLGRPLDREAICQRQMVDLRSDSLSRSSELHMHGQAPDECLPGACCQLLHVNVLPNPTALPKAFYIQVAVQDVNDNTPQFPPVQSPYTVIREDIGVDEIIWLPQAVDPDSAHYSVVEYRLEDWIHGNASHFQLGVAEENSLTQPGPSSAFNMETGIQNPAQTYSLGRPFLKPTGPLDRELNDLYAFTLIAVDGGDRMAIDKNVENRALTGSVNVLIKISDINDNRPTFDSQSYEIKVVENVIASTVLEFEVVDNDIGDNGRIAISIHDPSGNAQRLFRLGLHPITKISTYSSTNGQHTKGSFYKGFLQLVGHIDAERLPATLRFALVASDSGQPSLSSRANVQIHITNVNDNAPQIAFFSLGRRLTDNRIALPENNTPPLSLVVLVHVTDADSPMAQVRCRVTHEAETFSLEEATDSGFPSYRNEGLLDSGMEARGFVSGYRQFALRTKTELDRETRSHYVVTVECNDEDGAQSLSRNVSLHVTVTDVNDHSPVFDRKVYSGRVAENVASAEVHLTTPMQVTDADLGVNALLTFSLLDVQNGTTDVVDHTRNESLYFRTDIRSGRIWTVMPLDCETRDKYTLMIIVRDSGSPVVHTSSALVHVTVEDFNDNAPEFNAAHYLFEVPENSPGGTEIGRVEATDRDVTEPNRKLHYGLRGRPEDMHLISIDRSTGILRTRRPIDRESRSSISLLVTAENEVPIRPLGSQESTTVGSPLQAGYRLSAEASLVVSILNVNDNRPEFTLIEPHRSHITFIWEQLGNPIEFNQNQSANTEMDPNKFTSTGSTSHEGNFKSADISKTSALFAQNPTPVCERLPHRVTDKDISPENNFECCILELLDDFDGLFALMPEAPNVLCAMRRPPRPKSYKLTLVAKDGLGNDSLQSQIHFTVIIRSDPQLRHEDVHGQASGAARNFDISSQGKPKENGIGGSSRQQGDWSGGPLTSGVRSADRSQLGQMGRGGRLAGSTTGNVQTHQTVIIIVMASVAGILCILLLLAIILTKRCLLDSKVEFVKDDREQQNEVAVCLKSGSSIHSTPSKSQSCGLASINVQRISAHPEYYPKELIYHQTRLENDNSYELTTRALTERYGLVSPTIPRTATLRINSSSPMVVGSPTLLPSNQFRESPSPSNMLNGAFVTSGKRLYAGANSHSEWPPLHPNTRRGHGYYANKSSMPTCLGLIGNNNQKLDSTYASGTAYQTIDSRLVPHANPFRPRPVGQAGHRVGRSSEQLELLDESESALLTKSKTSILDLPYAAGNEAPVTKVGKTTDVHNSQDYASVHAKHSSASALPPQSCKLQRTSSERSNYFQTSFV